MFCKQKKAFISYAREDADQAHKLYHFLDANKQFPWMDVEEVLPGDDWQIVTRNALKNSYVFIPLLSNTSIATDGFVRNEFHLAIDHHRKNGKQIIPIRINDCPIPNEFQKFNVIVNDFRGQEELLKRLNGLRKKCIPWLLIGTLLILLTSSVAVWIFLEVTTIPTVHFKATVFDEKTNGHLSNAFAFVLGTDGDTLVKSALSGNDGQVSFQLDTVAETPITVWFYCPQYTVGSRKCTLTDHTPYRAIRLAAIIKEKDTAQSVSAIHLFCISGITLSKAEQQNIFNTTGFRLSSKAFLRFNIDYDHNAYVQSPVKDHYRFAGSSIYIKGNGRELDTGLKLNMSSSLPLTKEELEHDNDQLLHQLIETNRKQIISTLLSCLNQN